MADLLFVRFMFKVSGGACEACRVRLDVEAGEREAASVVLACALFIASTAADANERGKAMQVGDGHFTIDIKPAGAAADGIGRYDFTKTFEGDLRGTSAGAMLGVHTATKGSAGYVVIEKVTARLGGKTGSFMLQHFGIMENGQIEFNIVIIPDSGTDGLVGIAGRMSIDAASGHAYKLSYSFN